MTSDASPLRPFDVIGLGVNALDLVGVIDGTPKPDTKVPLLEFDVQGGGVVATAMVTCARLGLRTRYIGKVGTDFWSRASVRSLSHEGVEVRHVIRTQGPGHVSLVIADRVTGTRTLFYRRPSAYAILPAELNRGVITAGRLLHVDGIDAAAALQAVRWAREAGMRTTMDGERIVEGIHQVWPLVDLLVCNPRFVQETTGRTSLEDGLRDLAARGPSRVAVTLAENGALGLQDDDWVRAPGFKITPVDTTGAGDVFHGACTLGELRDWPLELTLSFANAVAAIKCQSVGGRRGIPRLPEVITFLKAHDRSDIARALA
jgi:sugar/nucleoside kinase (ribokinase family)